MATTIFGDSAEASPQTTMFGDAVESSIQETIVPRGTSPREVFEQQFIAQEQAPFLDQLSALPGQGLNILSSLVEQAVGGAQGLTQLNEEKAARDAEKPLTQILKEALVAGAFPPAALSGDQAQTILEGTQRAFDLGPMMRQSLDKALANPTEALKRVIPLYGAVAPFLSRTPTPEEVSQAFVQSQQAVDVNEPVLPDVFGTANIPAARGVELGIQAAPGVPAALRGVSRATEAITAPISRVASRGVFKAPLEDAVTRATGITAQEGSFDIIPTAKSRILEATKKSPTNAIQAYEAAETTEKFLIDKTLTTLKKADDQGLLMSRAEAIDNARAEVLKAQPSIPPTELDAALEQFSRRLPETFKPSEGQKFLVEQNDLLQGVFNETGVPARRTRGNAVVTARLGIADSLSNQLDEVYKAASGIDESPYRDWGQVREFKQGLNDQIVGAQRTQGGKVDKGSKDIPVTKYGVLARSGRSIGRALIPREIEAVDKSVGRIFKEAPSSPKSAPLDPQFQQSLIQKYSSRPTAAPAIATPPPISLSDDIKAALKGLNLTPSDPGYQSMVRALQREGL